jgi:glutamate-1-semialdehyde 2,1-aminomutase
MANGFSVAALAGRREVMAVGAIEPEGGERTFLLSSTHGAEMCGLAAFLETARIYREEDVCGHLWKYGEQLRQVLKEEAGKVGLESYVNLVGPDIALALETLDSEKKPSRGFLTLFAQEMVRNGVLMPWVAISTAHGAKELSLTRQAFRGALQTYQRALLEGLHGFLEGPEIRPVFRAKN